MHDLKEEGRCSPVILVRTLLPISSQDITHALDGGASRRVLAACVAEAHSAHELSAATLIPLTTVYRLLHRLERLHVLVVERSAMTAEGRKYDLYRSRVRGVHLDVDEEGDHLRWEPNPAIEERAAPHGMLLTIDGAAS